MDLYNYIPIICAMILFLVILILFKNNCQSQIESWENYKQLPYGNIDSGIGNPLTFYSVPRYRKPYRWPVCFITDHPEKHCRHFQ